MIQLKQACLALRYNEKSLVQISFLRHSRFYVVVKTPKHSIIGKVKFLTRELQIPFS